MPWDEWPNPFMRKHGQAIMASAAYTMPPDHHAALESHPDPTELLVPHVDPEDEHALVEPGETDKAGSTRRVHSHGGSGTVQALNQKVLASFITQQAQSIGLNLLHDEKSQIVSFSLPKVVQFRDLLGVIFSAKSEEARKPGEELKKLFEAFSKRLAAIENPGPSNLDRSCALYGHLRGVFEGTLPKQRVLGDGLDWPVPAGEDPSLRTAGQDLEAFYDAPPSRPETRKGKPPLHPRSDLIIRHSVDSLFGELETLRASTGGRIVNLHSDWRMWLAWLQTGNPILCLAWMNGFLAKPKRKTEDYFVVDGCYKPEEIEPDRALRGFLVTGYHLYDGPDCFREALMEVANGARPHRDVPVRYRLRNSWDRGWGKDGHAWIEHHDFAHQFGLGYGVLLPQSQLPGA